jgi:hypothetical protein
VIRRVGNFSWPGALVILVGAVLGIFTVLVGVHTPPNTLATALLQAFTFIVALIGAYIFARPAAEAAAQDVIRVHARSAFRRQAGLYSGLGRLLDEIDSQLRAADDEKIQLKLKILRAMIIEQAGMSGDALSDWRDLVPEEVAQLEQQTEQKAAS